MDYPWKADPDWIAAHDAALQDTRRGPVFCYQSSHDPWFSSSYYFETDRGVVLIDTQYFQSSAEELWENIQRDTSGEMLGIVITHDHPDHYWGNTFFKRVTPRTPIITSAGVYRTIKETYVRQAEDIPELFRPDCLSDPADIVLPDTIFHERLTMRFESLTLELWECGPAECISQVVGWIPEERTLIAGDVLSSRQTVDVLQQSVEAWQMILRDFARLEPKHVLTGHLGAAGPELLTELDDWFADLLSLTAAELGPGEDPGRFAALNAASRSRVVSTMRARHPAWWDAMMFDTDESILEWALRVAAEREGTIGDTPTRREPTLSVPPDLLPG